MAETLFFLAGESSGDRHGARLLQELRRGDPDLRLIGMGGPRMAAAGLEQVKDLSGMAVVGFWEVLKRYGFFRRVFYDLLDRLKQERPAALICIDYPGLNLRLAREAHRLGIPVLYYITPQVWAWKEKRAKAMARYVARAYCVFEFEPPFLERYGLKSEFVGHPLADTVFPEETTATETNADSALTAAGKGDGPLVALLPGSRPAEFEALARPLTEGFAHFNTSFKNKKDGVPSPREPRALLSVAPGLASPTTPAALHALQAGSWPQGNAAPDKKLVFPMSGGLLGVGPVETAGPEAERWRHLATRKGSPPRILSRAADFSVVCSGTATLEAALSGNPMCVVYRGGRLSFTLAQMLVDLPVISLVNIVLGRYAVPELLQDEVSPERIARETARGVSDREYIARQRAALAELPKKLGGPGAAARTAEKILNFIHGRA